MLVVFLLLGASHSEATQEPSASVVQIVQPQEGAVVRGGVHVRVDISPAKPIGHVAVLRDGQLIGLDVEPPFDIAWDTRREPDGSVVLTASAVDQEFHESKAAAITVTVDNTPPSVVLRGPPDGSRVSGVIHLEAEVSDAIGMERLRFLVNGEIVAERVDPPYILAWDTTILPNVSCGLEARAIDRAHNSVTSSPIRVRVANFNHYPVLDPVGSQRVLERAPFSLQLIGRDPDAARDPLTFAATNVPPWIRVDAKTGLLQGTPDPSEASFDRPQKIYPHVHVEVCDPEPLCDGEDFSITVVEHNLPPVLQPIEHQTIGEKSPLALTLAASDPDGDPLVCAISRVPPWAKFNASTCTLTGTPGPEVATVNKPQVVYTGLRVEVCDPEKLCAEQLLTITVENVENRQPVLEPIAAQSIDESKPLSFEVRATDADREALTLMATPLPLGATFTDRKDGTGFFRWTPRFDQAGTYAIAVIASDGALQEVAPVTVTVREKSLSISGFVTTRRKIPAAGVSIEVGTMKETVRRVLTDATGYYLASDLTPQTYRVQPRNAVETDFSTEARSSREETTFSPAYHRVTLISSDQTGLNFMTD